MTTKRKAFTLIEIIIAMAIMAIAVLSMFVLRQSSNKSSMDAYYEVMAFSLAREPIEIFRSFGYETLFKIHKGIVAPPPLYEIGTFKDIVYNPGIDLQYPAEAEYFQRKIDLKSGTNANNQNYIKITVTVAVKGSSKAEVWLSRKSVVLESIIVEQLKW